MYLYAVPIYSVQMCNERLQMCILYLYYLYAYPVPGPSVDWVLNVRDRDRTASWSIAVDCATLLVEFMNDHMGMGKHWVSLNWSAFYVII